LYNWHPFNFSLPKKTKKPVVFTQLFINAAWNKHFRKWHLYLPLLSILSCGKPAEENIIFTKASSSINDSLVGWLNQDSNYVKPNYVAVFYENYNTRIKANDINGAARLLNSIAVKYQNRGVNSDTTSAINIAFLNKYETKIATEYAIALNKFLGQQLLEKGKFIKAITYFEKAVTFNATNYYGYVQLGGAYYYLANCYLETGKPDAAFMANTKALECYEKTDYTVNIPSLYFNIASLHLYAYNYEEAIKSIDIALDISKNNNDMKAYYSLLTTKAEIYYQSENKKYYPIADTLYQHYRSSENPENLDLKVDAYRYYASMFIDEKSFAKAKSILDTIATFLLNKGDTDAFYSYCNVLSYYELGIGKPISNRILFEEEIESLIEQKDYNTLIGNYELLRDDAKIRKDFKKAFNYQIEITVAEDSLFSQKNKIVVLELEKKYETSKKEQQILLQKEELKGKNKTIALLFAALGFIALSALVYRNWQSRKKLKTEKQMTEAYTKQLLEKTEEDRKRVATDLHDSISHELMSLKTSVKEDFGLVNAKIDTIINDIRIISRNLHPVLFEKVGLQHTIEQLAERVQEQNNFMLTADIQYSNSLPSATELQVYRIIQEAVTNIIKYAAAIAGKITIQETATHVSIEIKDNGKGFNVAETISSRKAFGLHNIVERSRAIGGVAKIMSGNGGTIITINIPKNNS
jgi:two-component system, NarL family, sensor kinase